MNRRINMIMNIDVAKLTATQKTVLLKQILDSKVEADCLTPDIYIEDEGIKDEMLALIKAGKGECKGGFPKRYITTTAKGGITTADGKKYKLLTADNLKESKTPISASELSKLMPVEKEIVETIKAK